MGSQVAVAEVAVVPTFKGFRRQVTTEAEGGARTAATGFSRIFSKTGTDSGKATGSGFKRAFETSAQGASDKVVKQLEGDVAKASRALSAARLKEQDSIGKVRLAQAQLNEANAKYSSDSSQVVRAQERLATASRQLGTSHEGTERATDDLKRAQGELAQAADRAGDELAEAGTRGVNSFRSNVVGGVKSFAVPLIGAFAALGIGNIVADAFREAKDFVLESITLASDLEQSIGGVNAVFGEQSSFIQKWASEAANAVGLSQSKYNEFATVVGAQLKNLGVPINDVAAQTNWLVELGADLAAQYGGSTSDAVSALSSLLRGERDPIERYGVSMNEASVKAEALRLGLFEVTQDADKVAAAQLRAETAQRKYNETVSKFGAESTEALSAQASLISANSSLETALEGTTSELTAQQKAQATLSLLMKQTADAQGAFSRESDTLAGKQARNAAEWENIATQLGTAFLPVASDVADILSKDILPLIGQLSEQEGPALAKAFADILPQLTVLVRESLPLLPPLVEALIASLPTLIGFLQLIGPIFVGAAQDNATWTTILQAWMGLLSGTTAPMEFIQKILAMQGPLASVMQWAFQTGQSIRLTFDGMVATVSAKVDEVVMWIRSLPGRALLALGDLGTTLFGSGRALMDGFLKGIQSMFGRIGQTVSDALSWVRGFFPSSPAKRGPFSGSGWTGLRKSGEAFWDQWMGGMGGNEPPFPDFPGAPGGGSPAPAASGASSTRGGKTVKQYLTLQTQDPRLAIRQMGREAERAFAAS